MKTIEVSDLETLGAATLAVIVCALVSGPIVGWLIARRKLRGAAGESPATWVAPAPKAPVAAPPIPAVIRIRRTL